MAEKTDFSAGTGVRQFLHAGAVDADAADAGAAPRATVPAIDATDEDAPVADGAQG